MSTQFRPDSLYPNQTGISSPTFMARLYGSLALLLGAGAIGYRVGVAHIPWVESHFLLLFIVSLVLLFTMRGSAAPGRETPFTVAQALLFSGVFGAMASPSVYSALVQYPQAGEAAGITALALFSIGSFIGAMSPTKILGMGGFLLTGLLGGLLILLLNTFWLHIPSLEMALSGMMVFIFFGFTAYDVAAYREGYTSAMFAAVGMYINLVNMFLFLFNIFRGES